MALIKVEHVSFKYNDRFVLDDVSFTLNKQDYCAITGHNGSGKSTLLKLLLGILEPNNGKIMVHSQNMGYVSQLGLTTQSSFPATVLEIVLLRLENAAIFSYYNHNRQERALQALKRVDMEAFAHRSIQSLSGGQLQRVLLARELISNPDILFLDEPTNGLDQQAIGGLFELLDALNQQGLTIVLVTHHLDALTTTINRVFNVDGQKIMEVTDHVRL